jgi:hypothetical protein
MFFVCVCAEGITFFVLLIQLAQIVLYWLESYYNDFWSYYIGLSLIIRLKILLYNCCLKSYESSS